MLEHIRGWKLLAGSHEFPGPEGGTCINEAAIIAAGFPYKAVHSFADCPPCFSPVLSAFAISVNDALPHDERQGLMPLVLRLSGSRDEDWAELARLRFIVQALMDAHLTSVLEVLDRGPVAAVGGQLDYVLRGVAKGHELSGYQLGGLTTALGHTLVTVVHALEWHDIILPDAPLPPSLGDTPDQIPHLTRIRIGAGHFPRVARIALERAFEIGKRAPADDAGVIAEAADRLQRARESAPA